MPMQELIISDVPSQVHLEDLHPNGKLYSDETIREIQMTFQENGRYRRVDEDDESIKLKYAVIVQDGKYYAVYFGKYLMGKGGFGRVKVAQNLDTGEWLALKVQRYDSSDEKIKSDLFCEVSSMKKMGVIETTSPQANPVAFFRYSLSKKQEQHYMLMKFARGQELFHTAIDKHKMPTVFWLDISIKLLCAVQKMLNLRLLHRDLKLDNAFYNEETEDVFLVDYGFAGEMNENGEICEIAYKGTMDYIAPELAVASDATDKPVHVYNEKTEMYALACTLMRLLCYAEEVHVEGESSTIPILVDEQHTFYKENDRIMDEASRRKVLTFLEYMASSDPDERPSTLLAISFFKEIKKNLPPADRTLRIAFLEVGEYETLMKDKQITAMKKRLKKFHQVWLIETGPLRESKVYIKLMRELANADIRVVGQVFGGVPWNNMEEKLLTRFKNAEADGRIYEVSRVDRDGAYRLELPRIEMLDLMEPRSPRPPRSTPVVPHEPVPARRHYPSQRKGCLFWRTHKKEPVAASKRGLLPQ